MPLQIQSLNYDSKGNRASVMLVDNELGGSSLVQVGFTMNTTGDDTQHQINQRLKLMTKQLLQTAVALL